MSDILEFKGKYAWLSNFFYCEIKHDGYTYPTVEHAYQAAKTLDPKDREYVRKSRSPGIAKARGRAVNIREDWEKIKDHVMYQLVLHKFSAHFVLRQDLLKTAPYKLVEGNSWGDTYWGVCDGKGQNKLGIILMQVRWDLR